MDIFRPRYTEMGGYNSNIQFTENRKEGTYDILLLQYIGINGSDELQFFISSKKLKKIRI